MQDLKKASINRWPVRKFMLLNGCGSNHLPGFQAPQLVFLQQQQSLGMTTAGILFLAQAGKQQQSSCQMNCSWYDSV